MYRFDFGSGLPRWVFPPAVPIPGFSLILPSEEEGGVAVFVNLHRAARPRLQASWRSGLDGFRRGAAPAPLTEAS
jgi:hypothetical protein